MNDKSNWGKVIILALGMMIMVTSCNREPEVKPLPYLITWAPPAYYSDNSTPFSVVTDLMEYRLYFGTSSQNYNGFVSMGTATSARTDDPRVLTFIEGMDFKAGNTCYVAVTVINNFYAESDVYEELHFLLN